MATTRPWQEPRHQVLSLSQREFGFARGCAEQAGQRVHGAIESVAVDQPAPQGRLLGDDGASEPPQRRLHRVDRFSGFGRHGPFGDDPQSAGEFHVLLRPAASARL